jgi:hypothetical protein
MTDFALTPRDFIMAVLAPLPPKVAAPPHIPRAWDAHPPHSSSTGEDIMPSFGCNGARHFPQRVMLLNVLSTIRANTGYFSQLCFPSRSTFKAKLYPTLTYPTHHSDQVGPINATDDESAASEVHGPGGERERPVPALGAWGPGPPCLAGQGTTDVVDATWEKGTKRRKPSANSVISSLPKGQPFGKRCTSERRVTTPVRPKVHSGAPCTPPGMAINWAQIIGTGPRWLHPKP